jgi:hypothetical protein
MTLPQKESPAGERRGDDYVDAAITQSIYDKAEAITTADVAVGVRECRSCAAFYAYDNGQGECHRYAPKPNHDHALSVEWPRVLVGDFCLEHVARGGE